MPPANSPSRSPIPLVDPSNYTTTATSSSSGGSSNSSASAGSSSTSYLSALRQIDSIAVPDLASTLLGPTRHSASSVAGNGYARLLESDSADEANEANVSFLRTPLVEQQQPHGARSESQQWQSQQLRDEWRASHRELRERERERASGGGGGNSAEDRARRERLQRVLNRLNRMHDSSASAALSGNGSNSNNGGGSSSYGERIPRENSLYDWSPAGGAETLQRRERERDVHRDGDDDDDDGDDDEDGGIGDLQHWVDVERTAIPIYSQLRRTQPGVHPDVLRNFARVQARAQVRQERQQRGDARENAAAAGGSSSESSLLRAQAALQSSGSSSSSSLRRQHQRFSPRSREYMQRYVMDRERFAHDGDEFRDRYHELVRARDVLAGVARSSSDGGGEHLSDLARLGWQASTRSSPDRQQQQQLSGSAGERARAYRRSYLEDPSRGEHRRLMDAPPPPPPPPPPSSEPSLWLQQTITYLARLRDCAGYEDALSHAVDASFLTKEFFGEGRDDFLWDLRSIPRPAETSWLAPGAVFAGSQNATNAYTASAPLRYRELEGRHAGGRRMWAPVSDAGAESLSDSRRRMLARLSGEGNNSSRNEAGQVRHSAAPPDRWPVKVTVHAVDYDKMTIAATMEAYNVPSYNASYSSIISAANANASAQSLGGNSASRNNSSMYDEQSQHNHHSTVDDDNDGDDDAPMHSSTTTSSFSSAQHPAHPPILPRTSSITTYLEGEILDLSTHTFLTESYASTRATDATYWRKLEPFARLASDDDMVRTLVSQRRLRELGERYVLMRWKERCFIPKASSSSTAAGAGGQAAHQQHQLQQAREVAWDGARPWMHSGDGVMAETGEGCGLTISGFYYVCLRRSDGGVEGLYCDPESSPYQHLRLSRVGGGVFPVWGFR